ncbi:type III secretion protein [Paraburkholderia sp. B3]|uniref:type III secretion protein n=1 Tax=Paraburkholderia sp. B3 TaxID=3134791 RepID=UPI003981EE4D
MYEAIEAYAPEFDNLRDTLVQQGSASIDAIRDALETTARRIGEAQGNSELDRDNLSRLYRGFMAASRVVGHLQDADQPVPR